MYSDTSRLSIGNSDPLVKTVGLDLGSHRHDVVRGVKLGSDGFEACADISGGGVERIVAIHDSEETPAVNEHPHDAGFFQV
jgi:hypothetical protein